jgi:hypothetical protein
MKKSEEDATFYKLLFKDELYYIAEKKPYSAGISGPGNSVSEDVVTYHPSQSYFEGITSKTLIMFNYPDSSQMPAGDKVLLGQVLKAVGLSFDTVSRLNTINLPKNVSWEEIAEQSAADFVICFGVEKKYMPTNIGEGQIYNINGKRALCTTTLNELILNSSSKKLLWQGLKEIYGI